MKNTITSILSVVLALLLVLCMFSCDNADNTEAPAQTPDTQNTTPTTDDDGNTVTKTGVWANATHLKNKEFGEGAKTVIVTVKAEGQSVTFTIKTDKTTVGAAMLEHGLIEGEDSQYGLYIKKVNGILADYDTDKTYWAFYINGDYAIAGVDTTEITEGATYVLERTK